MVDPYTKNLIKIDVLAWKTHLKVIIFIHRFESIIFNKTLHKGSMNSLKFTVNFSSVCRSLPCTFHWGSPEYPSLQRSSTHIDPSVPSFFSYAPSDWYLIGMVFHWFIHLIGRVRQNVPLCNYIENVLYQNQCRKVVWYHFVWILAHQHIQHLAGFFSRFSKRFTVTWLRVQNLKPSLTWHPGFFGSVIFPAQ